MKPFQPNGSFVNTFLNKLNIRFLYIAYAINMGVLTQIWSMFFVQVKGMDAGQLKLKHHFEEKINFKIGEKHWKLVEENDSISLF